jgi:hypothetical protein
MARAVTTQVLFQSGDAASDGTPIDSIESLVVTSPSGVAFRGGTSAILLARDGTFEVVARTGDPIPRPLVGTFNGFGDPLINDAGAVAFRAGFNSPSAPGGVFLYEEGTLTQVARANRFVASMNNSSDIVLRAGSALTLWTRATRTTTRIVDRRTAVPGGGRFIRFGRRSALSDASVVAFQAEVQIASTGRQRSQRGIFTTSAGGAVAAVVREGDPTPFPGTVYGRFVTVRREPNEALSINASGSVAFTASVDVGGSDTSGVFLHHPGGRPAVVALVGDRVGGAPLVSIPADYVGIDTSGRVVFKGCTAPDSCQLILAAGGTLTALTGDIERRTSAGTLLPATGFAARLPDTGDVVWRSGEDIQRYDGVVRRVVGAADLTPIGADVLTGAPSVNEAGTVAFRATREAIYRVEGGAMQAVASGGDSVGGAGTLRGFGALAFDGGLLAFVGHEGDGRRIIAVSEGGIPRKLVGDGDPTPLGGTFELGDDALDVSGGSVAFVASVRGGRAPGGVFRANPDGSVTAVARVGGRAPGGGTFEGFDAVDAEAGQIVFAADVDRNRSGLFAARGRRLVTVARTGKTLAGLGRRRIDTIGPFSASGRRILFAARRDRELGLFLWRGGRPRRLVPSRRASRSLGRAPSEFVAAAVGARAAAFIAAFEGEGPERGIFLISRGRVTPLLMTGGPLASGGTVDLGPAGESITLLDEQVVFLGNVMQGAGARLSVLATRP